MYLTIRLALLVFVGLNLSYPLKNTYPRSEFADTIASRGMPDCFEKSGLAVQRGSVQHIGNSLLYTQREFPYFIYIGNSLLYVSGKEDPGMVCLGFNKSSKEVGLEY